MSVSHQIRRCTTFLINNYTENSDPIYKEWWRVQISRFDLALYSLSDENALGRVSIIGFFSRVELNKKKWERTTESKLRKVDTLLIHAIGYHPTESLGHKASCVILPQNFWLPCLCKYCEVFPQALVFSIKKFLRSSMSCWILLMNFDILSSINFKIIDFWKGYEWWVKYYFFQLNLSQLSSFTVFEWDFINIGVRKYENTSDVIHDKFWLETWVCLIC